MDSPDIREEIEETLTHVVPRKPLPQYIDDAIFRDVKKLLSRHPEKKSTAWTESPRLYTLLRMLRYHDDVVLQRLDTEKISDIWLPLGQDILRQLSSSCGVDPQDWRRAQLHVLNKPESMSEEKLFSKSIVHRYIRNGSAHFEDLGIIGEGGSAQVVHVRHESSGREFACKRMRRDKTVAKQRHQLIEFEQELGVLKQISHHHTVSLVASFTDLEFFSLILNPVAEDVLKSVLERQSRDLPLPESDIITLRRSFGCLATALAYLHEKHVRHKDIKPGNILLSEGRVILCDFGISRDWSQNEHSTTEGEPMKYTRRYCAQEVFDRDPRNTSSDIWSLGCVFLEILSVVKGHTIDEINGFFSDHNESLLGEGFWRAPKAMPAWLAVLKSKKNDSADDRVLDWIIQMTRKMPNDRTNASALVNMIHRASMDLPHPGLFIDRCCARADSIAPADLTYSPTLYEPVFDLGIRDNPLSPPRNQILVLPPRSDSQSTPSIGRQSVPSSRRTVSQDRSISPHTHSLDPRNSADTVPQTFDLINLRPEATSPGLHQRRRLNNIASRSDNDRSYSLSREPSHASEIASSPSMEYRPRSPVRPPADFRLNCFCQARPKEKHIFNAAYSPDVSAKFDIDIPTIEICPECEIRSNQVQVYESLPQAPSVQSSSAPLWWVTRRLVVSYLSGNPQTRLCSSFWVPLADIQSTLSGTTVILRWSDCNQMREISSGNWSHEYHWIYNPKLPNNTLEIPFDTAVDAEKFIGVIRLPVDDGKTVIHNRRVNITDGSEISIFDVGQPGNLKYRAATRKIESTSKLFIIWPEVDLIIQNQQIDHVTAQYQMVVEIGNVSTPTYHSNVRGEPAADYREIARFQTAHLLKSTMIVKYPFHANTTTYQFSKPPDAVIDTLEALTGWTLSYFAIVSKFKSKNKRFGSKKYGRSDVFLWEKEVCDPATRLRRHGVAAVTFRMHEDNDPLWISGMITHATTIETSSGLNSTVSLASKRRGRFLDIGKMVAAHEDLGGREAKHLRGSSFDGGLGGEGESEFVLTFEDIPYRRDFVNLVEKYKMDARSSSLTYIPSHSNLMRKISSLTSSQEGNGPPMR